MNIGEFKELIKSVPDTAKLVLKNDCCEWYGEEEIPSTAVSITESAVIIDFCI
jgi:hypothetical protein